MARNVHSPWMRDSEHWVCYHGIYPGLPNASTLAVQRGESRTVEAC
jgi:hypothetical protein